MSLYLAHGHATGIQRQDLVVEAVPTGLVLGNELWFEAAVPVARYLDGQFAKVALECLRALAVAGVANRVGDGIIFGMAKVRLHFGCQRTLNQRLGDLLEQAMSPIRSSGFL